ncbi:MAG: HAMP domain-containing protein [Gammaproteobacteria bacterium]|nr:HAMP domain-containing protein [Gammaproteobacteria bacterium]
MKFSIVTRIGVALALIVALALGTMIISYWISERADSDALAINIAGSLRMQTYKVVMLSATPADPAFNRAKQKIFETWRHPVFKRLNSKQNHMSDTFEQGKAAWEIIDQKILKVDVDQRFALATSQVDLLDDLVNQIQRDAEYKVRLLRAVQVIALFTTVLLAAIVLHWLRNRVEQPLSELTRAAHRIGQGDFTTRLVQQQPDELGVLATTLNKMSDAIASMYGNLQKRVDSQTAALQNTNIKLQFLYDMVRNLTIETVDKSKLDDIVENLQRVVTIDDIELCLITENGNRPYLQILPSDQQEPCEKSSCHDCVTANEQGECGEDGYVYRYAVQRDNHYYGVLVVRTGTSTVLLDWQQQLLSTVADHIAIAMGLKSEHEQTRRIALMQERTVIARELHDSLAQALSYLKIQVSRLNKAIPKHDDAMMLDITAELKQGLDNAYRQLRELLTTFRLKVEGGGLAQAIDQAIQALTSQSGLQFRVDYQLINVPLSPHEEIHLLQIIREASQNAVHHSKGTEVIIRLVQNIDQSIELAVEDNGVGIPESAEKLNHYGLAIMQERSRQLFGVLNIARRMQGGTGVYFRFTPDYLRNQSNTGV